MTQKALEEKLRLVIKDLKYPPLHPEFSSEDILALLEDCLLYLTGAGVFDETEEDRDMKELKRKISNYLSDIDFAASQIDDLISD